MQLASSKQLKSHRSTTSYEPANINVLVVDDNIDDFRAISRLLSRMKKYEASVTRASSGIAARAGINTSRYDVVIADYLLGVETGVDVIKSLVRQRAVIAPILVSGFLSPQVREAAKSAGAVHCIHKDWLTAAILESAIETAFETVFHASSEPPSEGPRWYH